MASVSEALLQLQAKAERTASSLREQKALALAKLQDQQHAGVHAAGHTPSGPRRKAEGIEDEQQGIVAAEPTLDGGARLRITLLAAGYVIGPGGASVREVARVSGADIKSWTEGWQEPGAGAAAPRRVRTIIIEGKRRSVVHALRIIATAVDRYVELTGGSHCGKAVDRAQLVDGVTFFYSPPPRAAVPYAAALREKDRPASPTAAKSGGGSPMPADEKENLGSGSPPSTHAAITLLSQPLSPHRQPQVPAPPAHALALGPPPCTPIYPRAHALLGTLCTGSAAAPAVRGFIGALDLGSCGAGAMDVDSGRDADVATTPAYRTYHLFGNGEGYGGGSLLQRQPSGGASLFASAFEAATPDLHSSAGDSLFTSPPLLTPISHSRASSLGGLGSTAFPSSATDGAAFLSAALGSSGVPSSSFTTTTTPSLPTVPRMHALSQDENALLAATGFPPYTAFAQQSNHYQPSLWCANSGLLPAAAPAAPQLSHPGFQAYQAWDAPVYLDLMH